LDKDIHTNYSLFGVAATASRELSTEMVMTKVLSRKRITWIEFRDPKHPQRQSAYLYSESVCTLMVISNEPVHIPKPVF